MVEECPICIKLLQTCKKLGDRSYCKKLLDKLDKDKISSKEFDKKLNRRFGKAKFDKIWNE